MIALGLLIAWGVLTVVAVYPWGYWPLLLGACALGIAGLRTASAAELATVAMEDCGAGVRSPDPSRSDCRKPVPWADACRRAAD